MHSASNVVPVTPVNVRNLGTQAVDATILAQNLPHAVRAADLNLAAPVVPIVPLHHVRPATLAAPLLLAHPAIIQAKQTPASALISTSLSNFYGGSPA